MSEISKLISKLSRSESLPDPWTPAQFVNLIKAYHRLCATITAQKPAGKPPETKIEDDSMWEGRPGAYEEMVERAKVGHGQGYEVAQGLEK